jgi:hypothetical protein
LEDEIVDNGTSQIPIATTIIDTQERDVVTYAMRSVESYLTLIKKSLEHFAGGDFPIDEIQKLASNTAVKEYSP